MEIFNELIVKNYKKFLKALNFVIYDIIIEHFQNFSIEKPDFFKENILYCYPNFTNFPFIEAPIKDYEFKSHISQSKNGLLIHLQSIQVLKIYPPECFMWLQLYTKPCSCINEDRIGNSKGPIYHLKHIFLDVLKNNYNDLRAVIKKKLMVCELCGSNFKELEGNRVFLNCQKVEAYIPELCKKTHLWLTDGFLNKLNPGMRFNGVCYYDINLEFINQNMRYFGAFKEYFVLISANLYINVLNKLYFQNLTITPSIQTGNDLYSQWSELKSFCDINVGESFIPKETLISLKLALFSSTILKNRAFLPIYSQENKMMIKPPNSSEFLAIMDEFNLHLFIMGENEALILRTILDLGKSLENFGVWPYNSDDSTLYDFLLRMQNSIIFIPDAGARLRKSEVYLFSKILRREEIEISNKEKILMNSTLWFYGCPNSKQTKTPDIWTIRDVLFLESFDNLDLVVDVSRRNASLKKMKHSKFDFKVSDEILDYFSLSGSEKNLICKKSLLMKKDNEKRDLKEKPMINMPNVNYHENEGEPGPHFLKTQPNRLMQAYFKTARKAKSYSLNNYNSFSKVCTALSLIRGFYQKRTTKIELIDVIIGIMLDEMTTSNKIKETEAVNSVVFGTVKNNKIGSFFLDCNEMFEPESQEKGNLEYDRNIFLKTKKEQEKKLFYEIYEEIMAICERVGCNIP